MEKRDREEGEMKEWRRAEWETEGNMVRGSVEEGGDKEASVDNTAGGPAGRNCCLNHLSHVLDPPLGSMQELVLKETGFEGQRRRI